MDKRKLERHLPLRWALFWLGLSVIGVTGAFWSGLYAYRLWQTARIHNPDYAIRQLVHQPSQRLPTDYLAELLELSVDHPTNIYAFDRKRAEAALLESPWITEAKVARRSPDTVVINYRIREPVMRLFHHPLVALDVSGRQLPLFSRHDNLPEVVIGSIAEEKIDQSLCVWRHVRHLPVTRIDVSRCNMESIGRNEAVVTVDHNTYQCVLRLNLDRVASGVARYQQLQDTIDRQRENSELAYPTAVVDLRLKQTAYLWWDDE